MAADKKIIEKLEAALEADDEIVSQCVERAAEAHEDNTRLRLLLEVADDVITKYREQHEASAGEECGCPICLESFLIDRKIRDVLRMPESTIPELHVMGAW